MTIDAPVTARTPKNPATASLDFPKGTKALANGLKGVALEEDVTLILKGKLTRANSRDWDGGKSFSLALTSCKVEEKPKKTVSLDKAIKSTERRV